MDDDNFFGSPPMTKGPRGGSPQPVSPGFGMTGRPGTGTFPRQLPKPIYGRPGDFNGNERAAQSQRGDRAQAALMPMPRGLTSDDERYNPQPPNFIDDVDIDLNWFSPFQPVWPFGPPYVNYPREWDYPVGVNLDYMPRRMQMFSMLRTLAQSWGILATVIEARIDELVGMPWTFALKGIEKGAKSSANDPRVKALTQFFLKPDRKHVYPIWMRMIFRDRYIIDAATVHIWRNALGTTPYALEPIDGATIKPLIDDSGRTPDFPNPAFQQIIKGLPMNNYTERDLLYMPARPRTDLPIYGYSEVEQVMMEATEGIRKTLYMLNFWQEGTIPDVMLGVPETWTPEQIAIWQASFDALLSGNMNLKSKIRFIPGGMKPFEMKGSAGDLLKSDYDEWIARIICFAFRMPPKPFIKEPESRASAEQEKEQITQQGLRVEMLWWKSFMDSLIRLGWGYDDIELSWQEDDEVAATDEATVLNSYVKTGVMTLNESRNRLGLDPVDGGDVNLIYTASGAVPFDQMAAGVAIQMQQQAAEAKQNQPEANGKSNNKGGAVAKNADPLALPLSLAWRKY